MKTKSHFLRVSGLFVFILTIFSCSKNDNGVFNRSDASFEITVTGAESMNLTGHASFIQVVVNSGDPQSSGTTLNITLGSDEDNNSGSNSMGISLTQSATTGFSEGTYTVKNDQEDDEAYLSMSFYSEESSTTYLSASGTVTLDKVTKNRVKGTMNAVLAGNNESTITISGSFDAYGISQGWGF